MKELHLHSVIVEYRTLFMFSADTDFYEYIGHERIYDSFLTLVDESSRSNLLGIIEKQSTEPFIIGIVNANKQVEQAYIKSGI